MNPTQLQNAARQAACAGLLALTVAIPAWSGKAAAAESQTTVAPDVQAIELRELAHVSQSPPFLGVLSPQEQTPSLQLSDSNSMLAEAPAQPRPPAATSPPVTPHRVGPLAEKYDIAKIGDRHVGRGFDLYSLEKEQLLGKQLATQVEQTAKLVRDPVITEYVNRIGQKLVRNSDARVPFTIKVVDNDEVNAFALPGGFFYVNTGLILASDNEAELAGVMAHEIAHVAARHATRNATRSEIFNLASLPLIFIGGPAGYAVRQAVGLAMPMSFLKFSRDAEREADLLGLEYQYASGYDPEEFVKFFEKLHSQEKKQKHGFMAKAFTTHPMTGDRIKRAQEEIAKYLPAKDEYIVDTSEFAEVKARLAGMENAHRIDGTDAVHPTLRKRGPEADEGRPKLERK
ncbi:MAG: M48 family metallopeptidase [Terriglobales bacterium]